MEIKDQLSPSEAGAELGNIFSVLQTLIESCDIRVSLFNKAVKEKMVMDFTHLIQNFLKTTKPSKGLLTGNQVCVRIKFSYLPWIPLCRAIFYMISQMKIINY